MQDLLAEVLAAAAPQRSSGKVADYIPALAKVDPMKLGIAFADKAGQVWGAGDCDEPFSIQSISKVFTLALALDRVGAGLWEKVGREPSGSAFNSIVQLESERGKPRNPADQPRRDGGHRPADRRPPGRCRDRRPARLAAGPGARRERHRRRGGGGIRRPRPARATARSPGS